VSGGQSTKACVEEVLGKREGVLKENYGSTYWDLNSGTPIIWEQRLSRSRVRVVVYGARIAFWRGPGVNEKKGRRKRFGEEPRAGNQVFDCQELRGMRKWEVGDFEGRRCFLLWKNFRSRQWDVTVGVGKKRICEKRLILRPTEAGGVWGEIRGNPEKEPC